MAGKLGNNAWWAFHVQGTGGKGESGAFLEGESVSEKAKGFKVPFSGGNLDPDRNFGVLAETDASRDRGVSYAKVGGVTGQAECYVRDDAVGALLYYALGTIVSAGTAGKRTHKMTPGTTLPYVTFYKMLSGTLFEEYKDAKVSSLNIKSNAGEPLVASASIVGVSAKRATTDPLFEIGTSKYTVPLDAGYVYNFNDLGAIAGGEVKLGSKGAAAATHLISSFDLTINNNVTSQQTDNFTPIDVIEGIREVDLSFDMLFENLVEYNKFYYGTEAGTTESNALYEAEAEFTFKHSATNFLKFKLPSIAYETYPLAPNTTGAPVIVSVKAVAQRNAGGVLVAEAENQVEKYV